MLLNLFQMTMHICSYKQKQMNGYLSRTTNHRRKPCGYRLNNNCGHK